MAKALSIPAWREATTKEYQALLHNGTWDLVPAMPYQNAIGSKWVFLIKQNPYGSVERSKAHLDAKASTNTLALIIPRLLV